MRAVKLAADRRGGVRGGRSIKRKSLNFRRVYHVTNQFIVHRIDRPRHQPDVDERRRQQHRQREHHRVQVQQRLVFVRSFT